MSDSGKENHTFDEDALKQALSEQLYDESEAATDPLKSMEENDDFIDQDSEHMEQTEWVDEASTEDVRAKETRIIPKKEDDLNFATKPLPDSSSNSNKTGSKGISRIVMAVIALAAAGFSVSSWMANQKIAALQLQVESIEARMNSGLGVDAGQGDQAQYTADSGPDNGAILMQLATQIMENREAIKALEPPVKNSAVQSTTDAPMGASSSEGSTASLPAPEEEKARTADKEVKKVAEPLKKAAAVKSAKPIPEAAKSAAREKGEGWSVVLMSLKSEEMADRELAALLKSGHKAEKHMVKVRGETYYQLRMGWFAQKDDAHAYIKNVITGMGYKDVWISHTQ
ncbi:Sporulation related domain-containing protein [Mariprofundus aestuarium]|uniref:Sporulation related domain-containing protein n=1 Tax=Mariprofundus aestuarium TaxID=1921086 RepID=A0A2K8KUY5_MARES|nr:SPOR domain-containing protein [Mariprofundus aestuarium]ATX78560.1 Sporulation related domain-containing protein [Mariprofundus aestuarium]